MASQILSDRDLQRLYDTERLTRDHDDALNSAALIADVDPVRIASALASRESLHNAAEVV